MTDRRPARTATGDTFPRGPVWVPTGPIGEAPGGPAPTSTWFDLARWKAGIPLLLVPVRIETRYTSGPDGNALRVRIIPDAISVAAAAPASATEIAEATAFWTAYHEATGPDARAAVWRQYVGRVGAVRAGHLARLTRPVAGADGSLSFPAIEPETPGAGFVTMLPDRWLVLGWVGDTLAIQALSNRVDRPLAVSPDPSAPVEEVGPSQLRIDPATAWMFDYDVAVERGMAVTVPLTGSAAAAADGVSTLVVIGLDETQDAAATANEMAALFDDHARSAGAAFVPQGTPTNNTATVRAGHRREEAELADLEQRELGLYQPDPDDNASRFASILGLPDAEPFGRLAFGADTEFARSRDMRTALFETVLGTYCRDLLATHALDADELTGGLADAVIDDARAWFVDRVTGGAHVPTIRIGEQPYGILPVVPAGAAPPASPVARYVARVVEVLREEWRSAAASVAVLDHDATDALGTTATEADAVARDLVARVLSNNPHPRRIVLRAGTDRSDQPRPGIGIAAATARAAAMRAVTEVPFGTDTWTYPVQMELAGGVRWEYLHALDELDTTYAQTLGELYDQVIQDVVPARPDIDLEPGGPGGPGGVVLDDLDDDGQPADPPPRRRRRRRMTAARQPAAVVSTPLSGEDDIRGIEQQLEVWTLTDAAIDDPRAINVEYAEVLPELHEFAQDVIGQLERHELRQRPLRWLDLPGLDGVLGRDDLQIVLTTFGTTERVVHRALVSEEPPVGAVEPALYLGALSAAVARRPGAEDAGRIGPVPGELPDGIDDIDIPALQLLPAEFRDDPPLLYQLLDATRSASTDPDLAEALARLADVDTDQLDWLARETLGLGGHRLDAWHTSLAADRISALRDSVPHGLYVGHYGVALDLARSDDRISHGFIHAPSLAHAASAAVLRSGWLARGSEAEGSPAAVDLVSSRIREADWLLSGVRHGQDLGSLLGAAFERGLHDSHLDVAIRPLRQVVADADGLGDSALDVPVDGIRLLDLHRLPDGPVRLVIASLELSGPRRAQLVAQIDAIGGAFDAVDDAMTFESVHQLVVGNLARAAAVLDGSGPNGGRPPELQGVATPRGALTVDLRMLVLIDTQLPADGRWSSGTRDRFDPALERWVASVLPAPDDVGWTATDASGRRAALRLGDLAISALDLLALASDDPTNLTGGLRRLAELTRPESTFITHDTTDPGDAPVSLADVQLLAVELRRMIHDSAAADVRAVVPAASAPSTAESDDLPAAPPTDDGLAALLGAFDTVAVASSWDHLPVDVAESLARLGLVPSPTADPAVDFAALQDRLARRRVDADAVPASDAWTELRARIDALVGAAVPVLAPFTMPLDGLVPAPELASADEIDDWFDVASAVQTNTGQLGRAFELGALLGVPPAAVVPAQVPNLPGDRWAAISRPSAGTGGRLVGALVTLGDVAPGRTVVGLVVDRWAERIPNADQVTGVTFHFDAPSAEAPQTMLLAAPPIGRAWSTDVVLDAVLETVEWMQLRAVALDDLGDNGHCVPTVFAAGRLAGESVAPVVQEVGS